MWWRSCFKSMTAQLGVPTTFVFDKLSRPRFAVYRSLRPAGLRPTSLAAARAGTHDSGVPAVGGRPKWVSSFGKRLHGFLGSRGDARRIAVAPACLSLPASPGSLSVSNAKKGRHVCRPFVVRRRDEAVMVVPILRDRNPSRLVLRWGRSKTAATCPTRSAVEECIQVREP